MPNPAPSPSLFDVARIGRDLPFSAVTQQLYDVIRDCDAVVQAPPGTGKTTLVPPVVANALASEKVLVTAPRRIAVRAAARRLAQLSGTTLGEEVGYTVRGDSKTSAKTVVEFVTPGVALRRLLRDGDLPGIGAIILDEVHERGIDTDMVLAFVRELREIRDDLRVVAMSATVDADRFARLLSLSDAPVPIVAAEAVTHPLDIRYSPAQTRLGPRGVTDEFIDHAANCAVGIVDEAEGDILVFMPGVREVEKCAESCVNLLAHTSTTAEVLTLHGRQSGREQDAVLAGHTAGARRIIVSTSVAESSLTVPGVRAVVDGCLSRGPRLDLARGFSGLVTTSCARSSADQRAGRAGREGPGIVVRCISSGEYSSFPAWPAPEIVVADLTQAILDAAAWGTPGAQGLPLLDTPPTSHVDAAMRTLHGLGAVSSGNVTHGTITDLGRVLATFPTNPRIARALLVATELFPRHAKAIAEAAAALSEGSDAHRLQKLARNNGGHVDSTLRAAADNLTITAAQIPGLVTALAWPDFIGRRRSNGEEYLFTGGTAASSAGFNSEWIAADQVTRAESRSAGRAGAIIRNGEPITAEIATFAAASLHSSTTETSVDTTAKVPTLRAREKELLGAIVLRSQPTTPTDAEITWRNWLSADPTRINQLAWADDARSLRRRLALLYDDRSHPWPDVSDDGLVDNLDMLFGADLNNAQLPTIDAQRLRAILPWPEATHLDDLVPERIEVPSGSKIKVDYSQTPDAPPILAVKLQECFGLAETPQILEKPVTMHLLSPAGRPLAVTQDLESFWNGAYAQVRSEMRGRYPKHPWPENPWEALPTARTKRR